jgi:hypothetical protein
MYVGIPPLDMPILGYTRFWIWAWTWALVEFGGEGCTGASLFTICAQHTFDAKYNSANMMLDCLSYVKMRKLNPKLDR